LLVRSGEKKLSQAIEEEPWPPGYFELFGSVDDESFKVADDSWNGSMASEVRL
jgi:hypothetical protein